MLRSRARLKRSKTLNLNTVLRNWDLSNFIANSRSVVLIATFWKSDSIKNQNKCRSLPNFIISRLAETKFCTPISLSCSFWLSTNWFTISTKITTQQYNNYQTELKKNLNCENIIKLNNSNFLFYSRIFVWLRALPEQVSICNNYISGPFSI